VEQWDLYARGCIVLGFLSGAFCLLDGLRQAAGVTLLVSLVLLPVFILYRFSLFLWKKHRAWWLVLTVLTGLPLAGWLVGWLVLLFARLLCVRRMFPFHLAVAALSIILSLAVPDKSIPPPAGTPEIDKDELSMPVSSNDIESVAMPTNIPSADEPPEVLDPAQPEPRPLSQVYTNWTRFEAVDAGFSMLLPEGYHLADAGDKERFAYTFKYEDRLTVTVMAEERTAPWNAEEACVGRARAFQQGAAETPFDVVVAKADVVLMDGEKGYEICLLNPEQSGLMMDVLSVAKNGLWLSVAIVARDTQPDEFHEHLVQRVKRGLRIMREAPKKSLAPKIAEAEAMLKTPEWRAARSRLDVRGSMLRDGRLVGLIGRDIVRRGDTVSVDYKGKTYVFEVAGVDQDGVTVVPVGIE
jgi:hypothetical protein